jgi:hypothetical protein
MKGQPPQNWQAVSRCRLPASQPMCVRIAGLACLQIALTLLTRGLFVMWFAETKAAASGSSVGSRRKALRLLASQPAVLVREIGVDEISSAGNERLTILRESA